MSLKIDRLQLDIIINGDKARQNIIKLEDELRGLNKDLKGLKKGSDEWIKKTEEIKKVQQRIDQAREKIGLTGLTMKELIQRQRELNAMMRNMDPRIPQYKELQTQINAVKGRIGELSGKIKSQGNIVSGLANGFNKYFGLITAFAASFTGVVFSIRKAVDAFNEYEERVDNLSALTGLAGDELNWLSDQAKEMSVATVEGGIKIKQGATDIVDAFTIVGSKRPELLKNKEALKDVTQEAIILSEAAKTELGPAVDGLTMALNQFDYKADQSRRIINVFGAGSKEGAGNISYLTEALEKSGTTANLMGLEIETWTAAIETVAPFYQQASMAGNSFDKVLLKLKAKQIGYVDGVFNLSAALDQLEGMYASGKSAVDIFGVEHAKMAEILVQNKDQLEVFTEAVTGTNVAIEQATKNTNNNAAALAQSKNEAGIMAIEFGKKLAPAMTFSTNMFTKFLKVLVASIDFYKEHSRMINTIVVSLTYYATASKLAHYWENLRNKEGMIFTAQQKLIVFWTNAQKIATLAGAAAQALFTGNLTKARAAMKLLTVAMNVNPFVAITTAIVAIGVAIYNLTKELSAAEKAQQILTDASIEAEKQTVSHKTELTKLLKVAQDETKSKEERQKAIEAINKISPEYLGNITLETVNTKESTKAIESYISTLKRKFEAQILEQKLEEAIREQIDLKNSAIEDNLSFWEKAWIAITSAGNLESSLTRSITNGIENKNEALQDNLKIQEEIENQIASLTEKEIELNDAKKKGIEIDKTAGKTKEEIEAEAKANEQRLKEEKQILEDNAKAWEIYYKALEEGRNKDLAERKRIQDEAKKAMKFHFQEEEELEDPMWEVLDISQQKYEEYLNNRKSADEDYFAWNLRKLSENEFQKYEKRKASADLINDIAASSAGIISNLMEMELEKAGDNEEKKKQIRKKYADIEFVAAAAQIITNTASAVIAALAPPPIGLGPVFGPVVSAIAAVTGATQLGIANAQRQKVKQLAKGKYNVIGNEDGKSYTAPFTGTPTTGLYKKPTLGLFAERGNEIVIDSPTTDNLMMNYPWIVDAILNARMPVRQYATGRNMPETTLSNANNQTEQNDQTIALMEAINRLSKNIEQGIRAEVSYKQFLEIDQEYNSIIDDASR